jgi:hypothetical protein
MTGDRYGTLTVVEYVPGVKLWRCRCDCGAEKAIRRRELRRVKQPSCGDTRKHWRADVVGYLGAHDRLRRDRGRAKEHQCVDCGDQAEQWSYDHADPDELSGTQGTKGTTPYPYSLKPEHYDPRCKSCHVAFDWKHAPNRPKTPERTH